VQIDVDPVAIIQQILRDKKTRNGTARFVLLEKIGAPYTVNGKFTHPVESALLTQVLHEASLCSR
jgi:3-dehydroquinate synthetase